MLPWRRVWTDGTLRTWSAGGLVVSLVAIRIILIHDKHSLLRRRPLLRLGLLDKLLLSGLVSRPSSVGVIRIVYAVSRQTRHRRSSIGADGARWGRLVVVLVAALVE